MMELETTCRKGQWFATIRLGDMVLESVLLKPEEIARLREGVDLFNEKFEVVETN